MVTMPSRSETIPTTAVDGALASKRLIARFADRLASVRTPFTVHLPDGSVVRCGRGDPAFCVHVHDRAGMGALASLHQLRIADAYIAGRIDVQGDFVAAMGLKDAFSDRAAWLKTWRRLAPLIFGRERYNPAWIQKHYDSGNAQLIGADRAFNTYTPGIYLDDYDTLEAGAERKLATAFETLVVAPGDHVLDIGCGWGGFLRYAARRGVRVTGITLSNDQLAHDRRLIDGEELAAEVLNQDFFQYEPATVYDGIVMMGVIEDLSDYRRVFTRLMPWLKPGGRIYLDFAAAPNRFGTGSFITTHVWPGTFRMVYMPDLMDALDRTPLDIVAIHNDRRNYHLWAKHVHERWVERRDEVVSQFGEALWRKFRILFAGCAAIMTRPAGTATAYRMVLQLPAPQADRRREA
jgi:cyclopropane-fatty-acyl-phospholipid synthase